MIPDVRTVWMVIAAVSLVFGALQVAVSTLQRPDRALLVWGAANLAGAAGCALLSLRGYVSYGLSVSLANGLIAAYWGLLWAGMREFAGYRVRWPVAAVPAFAIAAVFQWVAPVASNVGVRTLFASIVSIVFTLVMIADAMRAERVEQLMMRRVLIVVLATWTLPVVARSVLALTVADSGDIVTTGSVQSIPAMVYLVLALMTSIGVLLMVRERLENELAAAAVKDFQTGTLNRAGLVESGPELVRRTMRAGLPVAVLLMDLDEFKAVNDKFGHAAGDILLAGFATTARTTLRRDDLVARYGGEEFCAVLPGVTGAQAMELAEAVRSTYEGQSFDIGNGTVGGTVSIGVAEVRDELSLADAVAAADSALYAAKQSGRNRVRRAEPSFSDQTPHGAE